MIKVLALVATALTLSACGTVHVRTLTLTPPTTLMQDCPETDIALHVNGDLVKKIRSLRVDLKHCNADKAALRDWSLEAAKPVVSK